MLTNRRILTALGATGLVFASVAAAVPANATSSAIAPTSSDRVTASLDGTTASFTITGIDGTAVTVTAGTATLAGGVIRNGSAHLTFTTTAKTTGYAVAETLDGVDKTIATVSLGSGASTLPKPVVDGIENTTAKSVVEVTGEAGALVRVLDGSETVGVKRIGATGTTRIPVTIPDAGSDHKISVEQSNGAATSDPETIDWYAAPTIQVVDEYEGGAVVKLSTKAGGVVTVLDSDKHLVYKSPVGYLSDRYFTVPLTKGKASTFTVVRGAADTATKAVKFTATGSSKTLAAPTATLFEPPFVGQGTWIRVTGAPFTSIDVLDEDGNLGYGGGTTNASGEFLMKNVTPGETYRLINAIRGYRSAVTEIAVPKS